MLPVHALGGAGLGIALLVQADDEPVHEGLGDDDAAGRTFRDSADLQILAVAGAELGPGRAQVGLRGGDELGDQAHRFRCGVVGDLVGELEALHEGQEQALLFPGVRFAAVGPGAAPEAAEDAVRDQAERVDRVAAVEHGGDRHVEPVGLEDHEIGH